MSDMRLYVASLSDYNNGHLHGVWIDLDSSTDRAEIDEAIREMLRGSRFPNIKVPCEDCNGTGQCGESQTCSNCDGSGEVPSAEEWAVHDYEGIPAAFGEYPDLDDLLEFVQGVEDHGDAFRAFVEDQGVHEFIHADFQDKYAGEADSESDWIEQYLDDCGILDEVPENLRCYFDAQAYLRDMKLSGDIDFVDFDGTTYAFWNR